MSLDWNDLSEIVAGGLLDGTLDKNTIEPSDLVEPYNSLVEYLKENDTVDYNTVLSTIGLEALLAAQQAKERVENLPIDWVNSLRQASIRASESQKFSQAAKRLAKGEEVDVESLLESVNRLTNPTDLFIPLNQIDPQENAFIETGFLPIDDCVGGLPIGLTTIGAPPGVGKTTLMIKLAAAEVRRDPQAKVFLFSVEMTMQQLAQRALESASYLNDEEMSRIFINDTAASAPSVVKSAMYAHQHGATLIGIDFAELLLEGDTSESEMFKVYLALSKLAKRIQTRVILLSQLSRNYVNSGGGIPRITDLRYSGGGEALSALILLLYKPDQVFLNLNSSTRQTILPNERGKGYIIVGKSRFGTNMGGIGAIQVDWDGAAGWQDYPYTWFPLSA